jgi:hypothetical protein
VTNSVLGGPATYDSCTAYDVDYESVLRDGLRPNATWPTRPCRDGWDYDLEQIRYHSAVTEVSQTFLIISNYYFFKTPAIRKIFPPKLKKKFPSP